MSQQLKTQQDQKRKNPNLLLPLGFILDLKDTVSPIVIRRIQIVNAIIIVTVLTVGAYLAWDNLFRTPSGEDLVDQMIVAAGGMDTWESVKHGKFTRTHRLFNDQGDQLSEQKQTFYFDKTNDNVKLMIDAQRQGQPMLTLGKDTDGFWAIENELFVDPVAKAEEEGMMCDSKWCTPDCTMNMAFFRFSMPFKLTDNGVLAKNIGKKPLGSKGAHVVDITYEPEVGKDRWVFYANLQNKLIEKMEYHHHNDEGNDLPEEFYWSDHREVGGLMISHKWTRYWSNGKVLEEYTFANFDFESELPDHFDERPSELVAVR